VSYEMTETRHKVYSAAGCRCVVCGKPLDWQTFHQAHVIPQRVHWMRKYGRQIIHHWYNMRATCPTDRCNNAVSLGNNEHLVEQHAQLVREIIEEDKHAGH
jgi:hypothetical protein